jgi:hypothetical protein
MKVQPQLHHCIYTEPKLGVRISLQQMEASLLLETDFGTLLQIHILITSQ